MKRINECLHINFLGTDRDRDKNKDKDRDRGTKTEIGTQGQRVQTSHLQCLFEPTDFSKFLRVAETPLFDLK